MLHHMSVAVQNPFQVAQVLAEIWQGKVFEFYPNPGSYLVTASDTDKYGSGIEFHPWGTQLLPGIEDEPCQILHQVTPPSFGAIHVAISVPTNEAQIRHIAKREGWRMVVCDRKAFRLIELWVENQFLLELLTPEFVVQYLEFTRQPQMMEQVFGLPIATDL
ncbi:MAG: hypothetical protein ACM65M_00630 [Microcoleus sp.]